jgi:hypothetical protein
MTDQRTCIGRSGSRERSNMNPTLVVRDWIPGTEHASFHAIGI